MQQQEERVKRPSRRSFLKGAAAISLASASNHASAQAQKNKKFIAIQVGAVSFVDEGVDKVLDIFQERGHINALMLAVFTYGRGIAGRQVPGQPLPDHGAQEYDTQAFHSGSYAALHPEYYGKTIFKNLRAPDVGDFDLLASVVPKAKARGMQSYCWFEDVYNPRLIANFEQVAEVDIYGRRTGQAC